MHAHEFDKIGPIQSSRIYILKGGFSIMEWTRTASLDILEELIPN